MRKVESRGEGGREVKAEGAPGNPGGKGGPPREGEAARAKERGLLVPH